MSMIKAQDYLADLESLPPAPQILPQILRLLSDSDTDTDKVVELISLDPALTARVMQSCNSAFLAAASPAQDVSEAVGRVGFQAIYRMVAIASASRTLKPVKGAGVDAAALWKHSVTTALAAQLLAKELGAEEGLIFTAALLHDLGKVLLANRWKGDYASLASPLGTVPWEQAARERGAWATDHAELGGHLLASWKFAPAITAAVWHHHAPAGSGPFARPTACVCLADAIAHTIDRAQENQQAILTPGSDDAMQILNLNPERVGQLLAQTRENFEFVNALCRLNT